MGMIVRAAVLAALGTTITGCTAPKIAEKALGSGAINVAPVLHTKIVAPGIYKILKDDGGVKLSPICTKDVSQQKALKALAPTHLQSDATIEDDNPYRGLTITIPKVGVGAGSVGGTLTPQITLRRAVKYKVSTITEDYTGNFADYMIKNVASNCRNNYLQGDLLFVRSTAEAEKLFKVTSGGAKIAGEFGPITWVYDQTTEKVDYVGPNMVFGVTGERRNISR